MEDESPPLQQIDVLGSTSSEPQEASADNVSIGTATSKTRGAGHSLLSQNTSQQQQRSNHTMPGSVHETIELAAPEVIVREDLTSCNDGEAQQGVAPDTTIMDWLSDAITKGTLLDGNGELISAVLSKFMMQYTNEDIEGAYLANQCVNAPRTIQMLLAICVIVNVIAAVTSRRELISLVCIICGVLCLVLLIAETLCHRAFNRALKEGQEAVYRWAHRREVVAILAILVLGLETALFTAHSGSICNYLMTSRDDQRSGENCNFVYPFTILFGLYTIGLGRPRLVWMVPLLLLFFVVIFVARFWFEPANTLLGYKLGFFSVMYAAMIALKTVEESSSRNAFEEYLQLEASRHYVDRQRKELVNFIQNFFPPTLLSRLRSRSAQQMVDLAEDATCVVVSMANHEVFSKTMLPAAAAVALSSLSASASFLAKRIGLDYLRTIGDTTHITTGLVRRVPDPEFRCVSFALAVLQNNSSREIRIGIHSGELAGCFCGNEFVRYDIRGAALVGAQTLNQVSEINVVTVSEICMHHLPANSNVISMSWDSVNITGIGSTIAHQVRPQPWTLPEAVPEEDNLELSQALPNFRWGDKKKKKEEATTHRVDVGPSITSSSVTSMTRMQHSTASGSHNNPIGSITSVEQAIMASSTASLGSDVSQSAGDFVAVESVPAVEGEQQEQPPGPGLHGMQLTSYSSSCCGVLHKYDDPVTEDAFLFTHAAGLRSGFACSLVAHIALASVVLGTALHEKQHSAETVTSVGYVAIIISIFIGSLLLFITTCTTYRPSSGKAAGLFLAQLALILGAALTKPSFAGNDVSYLAFMAIHSAVYAPSSQISVLIVQALVVVMHTALTFGYKQHVFTYHTYGTPPSFVLLIYGGILKRRSSRSSFEDRARALRLLVEVKGDEEFRHAVVSAVVPQNLLHSVRRITGAPKLAVWTTTECVCVAISFAMDLAPGRMGQALVDSIRKSQLAIGKIEGALARKKGSTKEATPCELCIVKVFGGSLLLAGPIRDESLKVNDNMIVRSVIDAVDVIHRLQCDDAHFTAGVAIEQGVYVQQHAHYPSFDMFGRSAALAKAITVEAPGPIAVATERFVHCYESRVPPTHRIAGVRFTGNEGWRMRGLGMVRVQQIKLSHREQDNSSASSHNSHGPLTGSGHQDSGSSQNSHRALSFPKADIGSGCSSPSHRQGLSSDSASFAYRKRGVVSPEAEGQLNSQCSDV